MINLQITKIAESMSYDKKDIFQRVTKLTEEQSELLEAHVEKNDLQETIEEAVDNILVVSSIAYVIKHTSLLEAEKVVNMAYFADKDMSTDMLMTKYLISTGKMSDAIQKNQKIAASSYKGFMSDDDTVATIFTALTNVARLLATVTDDIDLINDIIIRKNKKWIEKSIEGAMLYGQTEKVVA